MPFIEEILNNIRAIICDLQPHHVHTFYEAVGYMIQAQVVSGRYKQVVYMWREGERERKGEIEREAAAAYIIIPSQDNVVQERLIEKYMSLPNEIWDSIIQRATAVSSEVTPLLTCYLALISTHNVRSCYVTWSVMLISIWSSGIACFTDSYQDQPLPLPVVFTVHLLT